MRIALAQCAASTKSSDDNLELGLTHCETASSQDADLILFPELWQTAYSPFPFEEAAHEAWLARALTLDSDWIIQFRLQASHLGIAIAITFLHDTGHGVANAVALIDSNGEIVLVHHKVHLCDFTWESVFVPGTSFAVIPMTTRIGPVKIGLMTCFDREFPESARVLALQGAELILCPNACLLCDDRIGQFRSRAFENMVGVAMTNYPITMPGMNGRSCVYDGVSNSASLPRDHCKILAGPRPGIYYADLDIQLLREFRKTGIWSSCRRSPIAYLPLTSLAKDE